MYVDAPIISMPPSNAAWSLLRGRRVLVFAFTLSVALHLFVLHAMPYFIQAWREPVAARFDAVLIPIVDPPTASILVPKFNSKRTRRNAKSMAPKPDTRFAAPENAIAVDRTSETGDEGAGIGVDETEVKTPLPAENTPNAPAPPSIAEAILPTIPVSVEKKEPDPPPPELPSRISIAYKMTSSISDGVADYTWTRDGDRFEIDSTMQATGFIVGNFVGALHQVSRGVVTPTGLQPNSFQIRRGEGAPDTAEFLRTSNELKLTRAGVARNLPLPPLIQDMQSFLFQLAFDAPKMQRLDSRLEVLVTNA